MAEFFDKKMSLMLAMRELHWHVMNLLSQWAKKADIALQIVYLFLIFLRVSKVGCREDKE